MMKFDENGVVQFLYRWGEGADKQPDNCRAIDYDYTKSEVVIMLETTSPSLRPDYSQYSTWS